MWYSETTQRDVAFIHMQCPLCGAEATFRLFKVHRIGLAWVIPWWYTKHYATCGVCWKTFELKKEIMNKIEMLVKNKQRVIDSGVCPNCGIKIDRNHRFCGSCGEQI
jgi:ribosomal protein S27AE